MLDCTETPVITPTWMDTLAIGDVVAFRFPVADPEDGDGPKARPCLIVDILDRHGLRSAEIAYGTTSNGSANRGLDLCVKSPSGMAAAGLAKPTRFVCSRRLTIGLGSSKWIVSRGAETPVIGRLDPACLDRLHAIRARIAAERDIAADRREDARRERAENARNAADVVNEWRRRREDARRRADEEARRRSVR